MAQIVGTGHGRAMPAAALTPTRQIGEREFVVLMASLMALVAQDLKRVLAYSTISHLGLITVLGFLAAFALSKLAG